MKYTTAFAFIIGSFVIPSAAGALTADESLVIQGRSIPENSISVSPPVTTTSPSLKSVEISPLPVSANIVVDTGFGVAGKPFILDGSKSQDDGVVRSFMWRQVSGPTIALSSASSLKPTFTPSVAGTYVFELVVTDSARATSVVQKSTFTVGNDAPAVKTTPPPPPSPTPAGDPDFDLLRMTTPSPSSGLTGSDSGVGELKAKTIPTVSNEGRDRSKTASDASAGAGSSAGERTAIGDPDFDLLNISVGGDDLEKFRTEVSSSDTAKKVTVRGWDPKKKEEIVGSPESVKTSEDLKVYVEAVALNDEAIKGITIKKDGIEVESREQGKLFWFIPVAMSSHVVVKYDLRDSSADSVSVRLPWWHVFVKTNYSPSVLETELTTGVFDPSKWQKVDNSVISTDATHIAQALKTVSNVLKTKHDTVKNSISNVR